MAVTPPSPRSFPQSLFDMSQHEIVASFRRMTSPSAVEARFAARAVGREQTVTYSKVEGEGDLRDWKYDQDVCAACG